MAKKKSKSHVSTQGPRLVTEIKVPAGAVIEQHEDGSATITIRKER